MHASTLRNFTNTKAFKPFGNDQLLSGVQNLLPPVIAFY